MLIKDYNSQTLSKISCEQTDETIKNYIKQYQHVFYPLSEKGERFPIADSELKPQLPAKPKTPLKTKPTVTEIAEHSDYVNKLSLGLANIERQAFDVLMQVSDTRVTEIYSVGGGLKNQIWQQFRKELLSAELKPAEYEDASFGVTKLLWSMN